MRNIQAAFFPVSTETLPIVNYIEKYSDQYNIAVLLTFPGSGLSEKNVGYADNRNNVGKVIYSDIHETQVSWTTLLVANHTDIINRKNLYNLTIDMIKTAFALHKTVICAAWLKPDDLNELLSVSNSNKCQFVYLPDQEKSAQSQNTGRLYRSIAPIIFVGGLIEEANTLEVFLSISGRLQKDNLNVISLSTDLNCGLIGVNAFIQLTYSKGINEVRKIYTLNNLIKSIEEDKHPDLFIVHLSGAIMEYNELIPNGFGILPYIISKAMTPDFFVCCFPFEFANSKFINNINEGIASRFGFPIDYVHLSNAIVDGAMILNAETLSVVYTPQEDVNDRVTQLRTHTEIPVFNLIEDSDLKQLCEDIKKQIKESQKTTLII